MATTNEESEMSGDLKKEKHMKLQNEIIKEVRGLFRDNVRKVEEKYHFRSDADMLTGESFKK